MSHMTQTSVDQVAETLSLDGLIQGCPEAMNFHGVYDPYLDPYQTKKRLENKVGRSLSTKEMSLAWDILRSRLDRVY